MSSTTYGDSLPVLGFAVLGLLAAAPLSGYDIAARMRRPIGFFWSANHSQIYPMLARLHEAGLVEFRAVAQEDRPDKKVYELTARGRVALRAWLTSPLKAEKPREELVVRAFLVPFADREASVAFYEHQASEAESAAQFFEGKLKDYSHPDGSPPAADRPEFGAYATLKYGVASKRQIADWCRFMASTLSKADRRARRPIGKKNGRSRAKPS